MYFANRLIKKAEEKHTAGSAETRTALGKMSGGIGIGCNALLCASKMVIGTMAGSVAITADGVNNLSDAASSIVTLLGFKIASKAADDDHPYGHGRMEYLSGLVVAALILLIGVELVKSSIQKILNPEPVEFSAALVIVLALSILVKLWMAMLNTSFGKHIKSDALLATAADSRNDVISTSAVLIAAIVAEIFKINIDGYIGLLVAIFIIWSGIGIIKDTIDPLLGEAPDKELVKELAELISSKEGVLGIHDMIVHDYGPGRRFASAHAEIDYHQDVLDAHEVLDDIEREAREKLHIELVLHYDPIVTDDAELDETKRLVLQTIAGIDERLKIHDFRMVRGQGHTNVIFDMVIPFEYAERQSDLRRQIEETLSAGGKKYNAVIDFDFAAFN